MPLLAPLRLALQLLRPLPKPRSNLLVSNEKAALGRLFLWGSRFGPVAGLGADGCGTQALRHLSWFISMPMMRWATSPFSGAPCAVCTETTDLSVPSDRTSTR